MNMSRKPQKSLKPILAIAVLATLSSAALAQSNVTLYGDIDASVRSTTNADVNGGRQTSLGNGVFENSFVGFKGREDLGGGNSAIFDLEAGFSPGNGALSNQGQFFGNQAWVGLHNDALGEIDAGRQYGLAYQTLGMYAPLGRGVATSQGAAPEVAWQTNLFGARFDNTLEYSNNFGPVKGQLQYSAGGVAGAASVGSTSAAALTYADGPISVGGVLQQSKDANSNIMSLWGAGGSFATGPATVFLSYFDAKRDPGFGIAANLSGGPLANTNLLGNGNTLLQRSDRVWTTGVAFQATPAMSYTLGYMHDSVKNDSDIGNSGRVSTVYAVADYSLSKRTDLYAELDHTTLGGGEATSDDVLSIPGGSQRTGLAAGLRIKF
ncbi:MAG TPA: porin [Burkholderiaceae bacterium]